MHVRPRTIAGFVLAPIATPIAIMFLFVAAWLLHVAWFADKSFQTILNAIFLYSSYSYLLATAAAIVFGIPGFIMARDRGWTGLRHAIAFGVSVALVPLLTFALIVLARQAVSGGLAIELRSWSVNDVAWWALLFVMSGAASGAAFWWIALRNTR